VIAYDRRVSIGRILDESWTLYTKFFLHFFLIALGVFAVVNLGYAALLEALDDDSGGRTALIALVTALASTIGLFWVQGALVRAVVDVHDGTIDAGPLASLRLTLPYVGRLILAGLLGGLAIVIGIILLIVPGLILLTRWALITQAIVLEDSDVRGAFGRSRQLVKGQAWAVFGIIVLTGLFTSIAGELLQSAFGFLPRFLEVLVGATIANAVVAPFGAVALTLVFVTLRELAAGAPSATPAAPAP